MICKHISATEGSVEVYVSFITIVLGALSFSDIIMAQDNGRFVKEIFTLLLKAKTPI